MKILDLIRSRHPGSVCRDCVWFKNDPRLVEEVFQGLKIMSSGYASVRDQDGICDYHQLYLSGRDSCPHFELRGEIFSRDKRNPCQ